MPPDAEAPAAAAPAAAESELPPAGSPERASALIAKHVAATERLQAAERAEEATEEPPAAAEPAKGKARGTDGKFLKAGEKPSPEESDKPVQAKPDDKAKEAEPVAGGLGKANRLVREGKIEEAMKLIGLDPEKLPGDKWAAWRHENKKVAGLLAESRGAVERERAEVQQIAQQIAREYQPLVEAKRAIAAENYDDAFKLMFGKSWDEFQREQVRRMANPNVREDPSVKQLRDELAGLRAQQAEREAQAQQQRAQYELQQRREAKWQSNVNELKESGDPRFEKAATQQAFMTEVWKVQAEHYDPRTDATLPATEAAELAYERIHGSLSQWAEIFGTGSPATETRDRGATNHATTGPGSNPVRRSSKSTSLNPSEAAEASPPVKLKGKALQDYWVRKTEELMRQERKTG